MILQRLMENLQINEGDRGQHEDAKYFLQDGTPYYGPTHVDENMLRRTGIMHSPESMPVFSQEQLKAMMERLQIQNMGLGRKGALNPNTRNDTLQTQPGNNQFGTDQSNNPAGGG